MVDDKMKQVLRSALFSGDSYEESWLLIKASYELLGFSDNLSDADKIAEYTYIMQQLNKYRSSKEELVLANDTYDSMAKEVESLIGKSTVYSKERKEIVYNVLRDQWLIGLYNTLMQIREANERDSLFEDMNEEEDE